MRRFSSYGPINPKLHYYAPRKELIEKGYNQLLGEDPEEGGHYITVWAPRQCGKSWFVLEVLKRLDQLQEFDVVSIDLEHLKSVNDISRILSSLTRDISREIGKKIPPIKTLEEFQELFTRGTLEKPVILILDEFDALEETIINSLVSVFRNIYIRKQKELRKPLEERWYLLHGIALIGVRSVLGVENVKGSPFNVQRSVHVPNLTYEEVTGLFQWYEKESGQTVEKEVVDRLYYETNGQPGLTCWFGELLTEGFEDYEVDKNKPITMRNFEIVYAAATYALPNNNILNIISKAKEEANKEKILEMFQTEEKLVFRFDNKVMNALYMNGIADKEVKDRTKYYLKFSCPFVQKRLFNYFSDEIFSEMGTLVEPFTNLDDVITDTHLNIKNLVELYRQYLVKNKEWLFKNAPRRSDMKIFESVYHFNLFSYLNEFLRKRDGSVYPEFPTGNGKIDLIIKYRDKVYGIELKSFTDRAGYQRALRQAAQYGKQLKLEEIFLLNFVTSIDEETRKTFEKDYTDEETKVTVAPIFIETGS